MELHGTTDIEAPIDFVFQEVSDFDNIARQAMRRGVDVVRTDNLTSPGAGMSWQAQFELRSLKRDLAIKLVEFDAPTLMRAESALTGLDSEVIVELVALSRTRTRLTTNIELKPMSLTARLLVQSLKLARGNIKMRLNRRMDIFARETAEKFAQGALTG